MLMCERSLVVVWVILRANFWYDCEDVVMVRLEVLCGKLHEIWLITPMWLTVGERERDEVRMQGELCGLWSVRVLINSGSCRHSNNPIMLVV